jgi:small-conductance mechanosensitive channel
MDAMRGGGSSARLAGSGSSVSLDGMLPGKDQQQSIETSWLVAGPPGGVEASGTLPNLEKASVSARPLVSYASEPPSTLQALSQAAEESTLEKMGARPPSDPGERPTIMEPSPFTDMAPPPARPPAWLHPAALPPRPLSAATTITTAYTPRQGDQIPRRRAIHQRAASNMLFLKGESSDEEDERMTTMSSPKRRKSPREPKNRSNALHTLQEDPDLALDVPSAPKLPYYKKRRFWVIFISISIVISMVTAGTALLVFAPTALTTSFQSWRLCFFIAGLVPIWFIGDAASRTIVWAVEKSMFTVKNALYFAYATRRPLRNVLRAVLTLGWWALMMTVATESQNPSVTNAYNIVLKIWACITLFMTANLLKTLLAKMLSLKFNQQSHMGKMYDALQKEEWLHQLLQPRRLYLLQQDGHDGNGQPAKEGDDLKEEEEDGGGGGEIQKGYTFGGFSAKKLLEKATHYTLAKSRSADDVSRYAGGAGPSRQGEYESNQPKRRSPGIFFWRRNTAPEGLHASSSASILPSIHEEVGEGGAHLASTGGGGGGGGGGELSDALSRPASVSIAIPIVSVDASSNSFLAAQPQSQPIRPATANARLGPAPGGGLPPLNIPKSAQRSPSPRGRARPWSGSVGMTPSHVPTSHRDGERGGGDEGGGEGGGGGDDEVGERLEGWKNLDGPLPRDQILTRLAKLERYIRKNELQVTFRDALNQVERSEVSSEADAKRVAHFLFWNIKSNFDTMSIEQRDLEPFLSPEHVEPAFMMLDADGDGLVSVEDCVTAVTTIYQERRNLAASLKDTRNITTSLETGIGVALHFVFIFFYLLVFQVSVTQYWVSFSSIFLAFTFMFGNTVKQTFENVVFLFSAHPFDVGDVLFVQNDFMTVKEITINYTICLNSIDQRIWLPNQLLLAQPLINLTASGNRWEALKILIDYDTVPDVLDKVRTGLDELLKECPQEFSAFTVSLCEPSLPLKFTLKVVYQFSHPGTSLGRCNSGRTLVYLRVAKVLNENGVKYSWPAINGLSYSSTAAAGRVAAGGAAMVGDRSFSPATGGLVI